FVQQFFALDEAVSHDGHSFPLLVVQLTELVDGVFVGCSFNHVVGDGTSFWHFFNMWSEISRTKGLKPCDQISRPPIIQRWFLPHMDKTLISIIPFTNPQEFMERYTPPLPLKEKIFHFSQKSMAILKKKANENYKKEKISSFQALCAHVWRAITRSRDLPVDQKTSCSLAINNRIRLDPPLSSDYFGNCIQAIIVTTTVGELLSRDVARAAEELHRRVVEHTDGVVRGALESWIKDPYVYHTSDFDGCSVMVGGSPRFDMYGNDFGWGKSMGARSGSANKFDGKVSSYPGVEGGGSVDLEMCLSPGVMNVLESD
ncbi:putative acetyltransferase At3g50280, partial [Tasmannia lanceolata]|uniref:putative acetyltransferase At3g50280 n=1 Tax=Tasmannia lanceolata TaxID=3420 RepID=UPI00406357DC